MADGCGSEQIPFNVGWQDLKDLFRAAGSIIRADVKMNPDGTPTGTGTVVYELPQDAQNAIGECLRRVLLCHRAHSLILPCASSRSRSQQPCTTALSSRATFSKCARIVSPDLEALLAVEVDSPVAAGSVAGTAGSAEGMEDRRVDTTPVDLVASPVEETTLTCRLRHLGSGEGLEEEGCRRRRRWRLVRRFS